VLVPFVFVFSPSMLLVAKGFTWMGLTQALTGCVLSIIALSLAFTGYWRRPLRTWERWLLGLAAWPMVSATWGGIALGIAMMAPVALRQFATPPPAARAG
jgi:TRAP-type uncharacterized transport system fused permease subunit